MTDELKPSMTDHERGCEGRNYTCTCGYDAERDAAIAALMAENERLRDERNLYKGKYRSMATLMEKARSQIRQVSDHIEDEGDRTYFGSTNHADWLRDLAEEMEGWVFDFELPRGDINKMERDPYAEIRKQRTRAATAEARLAEAVKVMEPFAKIGVAIRDSDKTDDRIVWGYNEADVTFGDFRAARAFIDKEKSNG